MKLSIITVNLNNASGLRKTIESVVSQSYTNYEYIVIDGGSSDGSVEVIKEFADRIVYWASEPDGGIYNAMNKGIKKANGEYCHFLNSGDFLHSFETIEEVFKLSDESDIIYGDVILTQQDLEKKWVQKHPDDLTFLTFYMGGICHQAAFIKRKLFEDHGLYDESYKIMSDWEFFINAIILSNATYKHINLIVSVYSRDGFGNQNTETGIVESKQVLDRKFPGLVLKDYELYKNHYSDLQALVGIKKFRLSFFLFKALRKTTRIYRKWFQK